MTEQPSEQTNGIDSALAEKYLALEDESAARLLELQMDYMSECREVREAQKRHFKSAVAEGMPADAWRTYLKEHRIKAKAAKQIENLYADAESDDIAETAALIREALGADFASLPLGDYAVSRAPTSAAPKPEKKGRRSRKAAPDMSATSKADALGVGEDDDDVDLRGARQKEREALRQEEAAARLSGIKPLPGGAAH